METLDIVKFVFFAIITIGITYQSFKLKRQK